ncbi:Uncharacterised protein [Sphingobacterium multivorum]|nr:Uncharacterised protein [Sphingobacterium multivorum]
MATFVQLHDFVELTAIYVLDHAKQTLTNLNS